MNEVNKRVYGLHGNFIPCISPMHLKDYSGKAITLNSSPYGVLFYKAIGFVPADEKKAVNGIRFTPIKYEGI